MRSILRSSLSALSLVSLAGCSFATHFEDYTVEAGPLACSTATLSEGAATTFDTTLAANTWSPSCGGDTSPDVAFEFTAPITTYYRVTTAGTSFDTVLAVRDPSCSASANELACNNDDGASPTSQVILPIDQEHRVLIVVDGNATQGAGQVLVERIACPADSVLASTPINHTTIARPNDHSGSCGGAGGDHAYRFVPQTDGIYAIRAIKNATQTRVAVYVEAGPECGGEELGCNAGTDGRTEVVRQLTAGEPITVWVDALDVATDGAYTLTVEPRPGAVCNDGGALGFGGPVVDSLPVASTGHHFSTSCAATSVWWNGRTNPTDVHEFPDRSYSFQTAQYGPGCGAGCNLVLTAHFPFAAEVLHGSACAGPVESCGLSTIDQTDPLVPVWSRTIPVPGVPSGGDVDRTLIIDRLIEDYQGGAVPPGPPESDDVTIQLQCYAIC